MHGPRTLSVNGLLAHVPLSPESRLMYSMFSKKLCSDICIPFPSCKWPSLQTQTLVAVSMAESNQACSLESQACRWSIPGTILVALGCI